MIPVGLIATQGAIQSGWLRVLHDEIEGFGQSMATASRSGSPDVDAHLAAIAEAARRTAEVSGVVLAMLDYAVLDIGGTIRRWNTELPVLRQAIERLSLMLDEWPSLMKLARDALRGPSDEVPAQLRVVRSMLPRMPDVEPSGGIMRRTAGRFAVRLRRSRRETVANLVDALRFSCGRTPPSGGR